MFFNDVKSAREICGLSSKRSLKKSSIVEVLYASATCTLIASKTHGSVLATKVFLPHIIKPPLSNAITMYSPIGCLTLWGLPSKRGTTCASSASACLRKDEHPVKILKCRQITRRAVLHLASPVLPGDTLHPTHRGSGIPLCWLSPRSQ